MPASSRFPSPRAGDNDGRMSLHPIAWGTRQADGGPGAHKGPGRCECCGAGCCLANPASRGPGVGPHHPQEPERFRRPQQPAVPLLPLQCRQAMGGGLCVLRAGGMRPGAAGERIRSCAAPMGWRCTNRSGMRGWSCLNPFSINGHPHAERPHGSPCRLLAGSGHSAG